MNLKQIQKYEKKIYKLRTSVQALANSDDFCNARGVINYSSDDQDRWYQLHHILCAAEFAIQDIRIAKEELG